MSLRPREIVFEESWEKLLEIIRGVITLNRLRKIDKPLWHNTFSDVYMLCVAHPEPHSKQLYDETKKLLETHVISIHDTLIENSDEKLLNLYHQYWLEYSRGSEYLNNLFIYLNTQYVKKNVFNDADVQFGSSTIDSSEHIMDIGEAKTFVYILFGGSWINRVEEYSEYLERWLWPDISTQIKAWVWVWVVSESVGTLEKNKFKIEKNYFLFLGMVLSINFKNKKK